MLELNAARTLFKKRGRLLISRFLDSGSAEALGAALAADLPYHQTMTKNDESVANVLPADIAAAGEDFRRRLLGALYAQSASKFAYFYGQFEFDKNLKADGKIGALSRDVWSFLNGPEFLGAIGKMTGMPDLKRASGQASRYAPGDFLTQHDDDTKDDRRAAFVLYLSPQWLADWGGLLQFIDRDGHVAEAFTPMFNALALFKVPMQHSVSMVTPLALGPRLAISGWVH
jgi:Rps23 Pro-64 3,4-dihydroxylase Tpa1-like proline 4-hydroxylase